MPHVAQPSVAFQPEQRRTAMMCCFPLAVTSLFVALEYALQAVILCFDGVPLRFMHQVIQLVLLLSFHPFAPQTSELYYHSFLAGLFLVVLLSILGGACYAMLSVGEDLIRVLASPHSGARSTRRLFPRKVLFRITLPVGIPSLDDMLSPPQASSRTILSVAAAREDEAVCEKLHPTPLQRVYLSLLNTFALQLEKANTILVAVSIPNQRWRAMIARLATERQGMESQKISADVSPLDSKNLQQWYYKNKKRLNAFFRAIARKEALIEFDVIQARNGLWHLFDENVEVIIDLNEFDHLYASIMQASDRDEKDLDQMIQTGQQLRICYGRGYLPDLVHEEGFEEWGVKAREQYRERYLEALLRIAQCAETAGQQRQDEQQLAYLQEAAQFNLECAIAASDTLSDAERRGEPALQKCLALYIRANAIPAAKNAYYRYEQHIKDHLCDTWEPSRATRQLWEKVRGKQV